VDFVLAVLASPFKSKCRLEAKNAALRHQLIFLRRKMQRRVRLTNNDRWLLIRLYRGFSSILQVLTIVQPENIVRGASGRLSLLLALEIALPGRAAADRDDESSPMTANISDPISFVAYAHAE
jgi:hypothetical protein